MNKAFIISFLIVICSCGQIEKQDSQSQIDPVDKESELHLKRINNENDSLRLLINKLNSRYESLIHATTGDFREIDFEENDIYGESYRIEIYQSEIYHSLYISRIEFFGESNMRITSSTKCDFSRLVNDEETSNMEFLEWTDFDKFRINIGKKALLIKITKPDSFIIMENQN